MDIVLVGGGVSAILLAEALAARRCFRTLRIVAPDRPLRAHRLSYWSDQPTPFDSFADGRWDALRVVAADGVEARVRLSRHVYRTMRPQEWIAAARERLARDPSIDWIDARVERVTTEGDRAVAHVRGGRIEADWLFSSTRPPGPPPSCRQRFEGWEVRVPEGSVEQGVATLLDFRTPAEGDFRFIYALPLAPGTLFLEHVSYRSCDHARAMETYLREVLSLREWIVMDREHGATPAFRDLPRRQYGRVFHIGAAAGLAKAATGYALTRMWRDAEAIAQSLADRRRPSVKPKHGWLYRVADRYFVDQVGQAPQRLVELVSALFRSADGDAVLAFLDDHATLREQVDVALKTPLWLRWLVRG